MQAYCCERHEVKLLCSRCGGQMSLDAGSDMVARRCAFLEAHGLLGITLDYPCPSMACPHYAHATMRCSLCIDDAIRVKLSHKARMAWDLVMAHCDPRR